MLLVLISTITTSSQDEAKRLAIRDTPAGKSALAIIFGTNGSYAIVAPYGRYVTDNAPFDLSDIKLAFESRSIIKRFKDETEIYIQNNSNAAIKRIDLRVDVYDKQRRKLIDTLYVNSSDTFKPGKKGRGYFYISDFRASGDLFLLFVVTKAELADGTTWNNTNQDSIIKDMQKTVENGDLH